MATMTVDCGSFNKTSKSGNTTYGNLVNFSIPAGATITGCSISFVTHGSSGQTADRAFILNGARAHSSGSWAQAGALNAGLLSPGGNSFRINLKSKAGTLSSPGECWWSIGSITLTITYTDGGGGGGGSAPPVGGGGPVVITPSSINVGAGSVTVICPAEAGIWHMIDWTFGSQSGSWSHRWETGGTNSINVPVSWISEISNGTSGILAIRVRRSTTPAMPYSYATDQTTNVTINVPAAGTITPPTSVTAGQTLSVPISAAGEGVSRRVGIYNSSGTLIDYLAVAGAGQGTLTYDIPTSWCSTYAPNTTYFNVKVRMEPLISGTVVYGTVEKTLRINVPSSAVPTIGTFTATLNKNGVDASITKYVQNYSKVGLAIGGEAGALGSSIASYSITGGGKSAATKTTTFGPFSQTGNITFTAKVTDSRGRVGQKTVAINVEPYSAVSVNNLKMYRSNASKIPDDEGAFATLIGKIVFSSISGQNAATIKGRVYEKGTTAPGWTTMSDNTLVLFGGSLSVEKVYTAEISINDLITSYRYSIEIPTATVVMGIAPNGDGVSFGTYPEARKVKSVWPIVAPGIPPNPNILHNWDFTNPINQRGLTTASGVGYWLDRWTLAATAGATYTYSTTSGLRAITTSNTIAMRQYIENPNAYAGKTVTVSVEVYSASITASCSVRLWYNGSTQIGWVVIGDGDTGIKSFTATIPNTELTDLSVAFYNYGGNDVRIKRIKLELGTVSTLHLDPPMDHAVELAKCQRFFEVMQSPGRYETLAFSTYHLYSNNIFFSVPKRVVPTVVLISDSGSERGMITERTGSSVFSKNMPAGYTASTRGFSIHTKDANNRFTAGYDYRFRYEASADL